MDGNELLTKVRSSKIEKLNVENKINEVARLLSGERITLDSLKQAQNMIVKQ